MTKAARLTGYPHLYRVLVHLQDHVIPHERNNHHPHVLAHRALFGYSLILILVKVFTLVAVVALPASSLYSSSVTPANVVALTNEARRNVGLTELKANDTLAAAAAAKANDMVEWQYFAHVSPSGVTPWDWVRRAGYTYQHSGENLAVHYTTAEDATAGWLASPSHRANILDPRYTEIGIGVATGPFEGVSATFVVQLFGTPKPAPAPTPAPAPQLTFVPARAVTPELRPAPVTSEPVVAAAADTPPPTPTPAGEPAPAPSQPVVGHLAIDTSAAVVRQSGEAYEVSVPVAEADGAVVNIGSQAASLQRQPDSNEWRGTVPFEPNLLGSHGTEIIVTAWNARGETVSQALAWVAPRTETQAFYAFNESDRQATLFGLLKITNLTDRVKQFYLIFAMLLGAALLVNILVKIQIQKPTVIAHTGVVLALAVLLLLA